MSIRFTCTACRTVMKVDSRITEEKKVRCTGCRIVILLTPDDNAPDGMVVSIPKKSEKPKGMSESRKRALLSATLFVIAMIVAGGIWYSLSGPPTHATVVGDVNLDGAPLEKGTIEFSTVGEKKITATAGIVRGRYEIRAGIGSNKVKITGEEGTTIAAKYNKETTLDFNVVAGSNTKNFEVHAK